MAVAVLNDDSDRAAEVIVTLLDCARLGVERGIEAPPTCRIGTPAFASGARLSRIGARPLLVRRRIISLI